MRGLFIKKISSLKVIIFTFVTVLYNYSWANQTNYLSDEQVKTLLSTHKLEVLDNVFEFAVYDGAASVGTFWDNIQV
ncbi:MAG: hypothetical protein ABIA04_15535 [Pseudomonadota bacterium]